jgi:hypothetical protein
MTAFVTMRATLGWRPAFRALVLWAMLVGVAGTGLMARRWLVPLTPEDFQSAVVPASIAACIAACLGAMMATACWEVRSCTYSWAVPGLLRSLNRELLVGGFAIGVFGAALGAAVHGALVNASWGPAVAAMLGYAAGASFMMPRGRVSGAFALIAIAAIFFAIPDIVSLVARIGPLGAVAAMVVMVAVLRRNDATRIGRECLDAGASWLEAAGPDARLSGRKDPSKPFASHGAGEFQGVRRGDLDWLRALIHEVHGEQRGGLIANGARWAWAMLVIGGLTHAYLYALKEQLPADFSSTFFPVAIVMSLMVVSAPVLPLLGVNRPLSRRRLAWLLWLRTQVEEAVVLGAVLTAFVAVAIVIDLFVAIDAWAGLGWWTQTLLAAFALLPFARWIRLHTIDGDPRVARSMGAAIFPGSIAGQAATMCLLLFGSWGVVVGWHDLMDRLEAFAPVWTFGAWGGALLVAAAFRWWWLLALRRFLERRDLVAA